VHGTFVAEWAASGDTAHFTRARHLDRGPLPRATPPLPENTIASFASAPASSTKPALATGVRGWSRPRGTAVAARR